MKTSNYTRAICLFAALALAITTNAQTVKFAAMSDIHIGVNSGAACSARQVVEALNNNTDIEFVLILGDITHLGKDAEFDEAHRIISTLNKPYYTLTGNHDTKYGESCLLKFRELFGSERFCFESNGYHFVGAATGPFVNESKSVMSQGDIEYIKRCCKSDLPTVLLTHHQPDLITNFKELGDSLEIAVSLCGHIHLNRIVTSHKTPAFVCCSTQKTPQGEICYNEVMLDNGKIKITKVNICDSSRTVWVDQPIESKK